MRGLRGATGASKSVYGAAEAAVNPAASHCTGALVGRGALREASAWLPW